MVKPLRGSRLARTALGLAPAILLVVALAAPALADHDDRDRARGRGVEVVGVIVSLNVGQRAFLLREDRRGEDRFWVVRVHPNAEIEVDRRGHRDEDRRGRDAFRILRVGDLVEVEGQLLGNRQILAREIELLARARAIFPAPVVQRPPRPVTLPEPAPAPFPFTPVILHPASGAAVTTQDITVIGRTFPGAVVHTEVAADVLALSFPVASSDVVADGNGVFVFTVRPLIRIPGALYRITVTSRIQGAVSPPAAIVVRQL